jgi:hypothetical protein
MDKDDIRNALAISRRVLDLACEKDLVRPPTCLRTRGALRILDRLVQRGEIRGTDIHLETIRLEDVHYG